jgi:hypothetical protein
VPSRHGRASAGLAEHIDLGGVDHGTTKTARERRHGERGQGVLIGAVAALIIGSAGVAIFPDIAQLAAPFVCRGKNLTTTTTRFSRCPGSGGTQTAIARVDAAGETTEVDFFAMMAITLELGIASSAEVARPRPQLLRIEALGETRSRRQPALAVSAPLRSVERSRAPSSCASLPSRP